MSKYAENLNYVTGKYVRCLNNKRFLFFKGEPRRDEELVSLVVGKVYKLAPPEPNDGELLRVIDESGEDYLYPASYFEPLLINDEPATDSVTTHLPPWLKGVLYAEAVAADKPVSVLLREWIEERLDLPRQCKRRELSGQCSISFAASSSCPCNSSLLGRQSQFARHCLAN